MSDKKPTSQKVELIADADYLPALLKLLSSAKKSVDVMAYSFAIGSAAGKMSDKGAPFLFAKKLVELKELRGTTFRVRVYLEGTRDTSERNRVTARYLKKAAIEVKFGATHAKGVAFDGKTVLIGSTNFTNQSMTKNREANVLMKGVKYARGFEKYFKHLWEGGKHGGVKLPPPFFADGSFHNELIDVIDNAKKKVDFSIYLFNQKDIEAALVRAHHRGVKVRGFIHQHGSFALSYIYANRRTMKRLESEGLYDLHFSRFSAFYHSKYLVADAKEILLGTGNWLEEDVHIHPQLYVHLSDTALAKKILGHLTDEIKNDSFLN